MKPGVYENISFEDYVKIDAVNNSTLKILADQSPAHCKQYMDEGRPETTALFFGKATDCYLLEPSLFAKQYVVGPDVRRNTNVWKEFEATVPEGVEILKPDDMDAIISICNRIQESKAMRLLQGGHSQVVCIWEDAKTGLLCKSRMDYLIADIPLITDLKTTRSAKPDEFAKDVFNMGYFQQAAFYTDGYMLASSTTSEPSFSWFAVEKKPPYVVSAFECGAKTLEVGRMAYRKALDVYAKCLKNNRWPSYQDKITILEMPMWALTAAGFGPDQMR
jgi:hypothetical protein